MFSLFVWVGLQAVSVTGLCLFCVWVGLQLYRGHVCFVWVGLQAVSLAGFVHFIWVGLQAVSLTCFVCFVLGGSGWVVNSRDFYPALLKSLGCFYFRCVLSSQWKAVTVNLRILHCQL